MGLLSFLKREQEADKPSSKAPPSADDVQRARVRARRRLIGAVVLLGIGIIAFPLVFETQPRPIPVDLPIEIPRKESAPPLVAPPAKTAAPRASGSVTGDAPAVEPKPAETKVAETKPAASAPAPSAASVPAPAHVPPASRAEPPREPAKPPVVAEAPKPAKPAEAPPADAPRAKALLEGRGDDAAAGGKFVVQVGAFSDAAAANTTRSKVEKLGLKTFTQSVDTGAGKRIRVRVGPFASRDEADKAAARIKSAGFGPQVLAL